MLGSHEMENGGVKVRNTVTDDVIAIIIGDAVDIAGYDAYPAIQMLKQPR
jgi:hypothetical protein